MRTALHHFRSLIEEQTISNQNRSIMRNVTRHVLPLRADMARLRRFVDSFLNFMDDEVRPPFYFQPVAPVVIFELLYYPYLAVASRNLISYPQSEMSFSIPLECYAIEDGELVFKQYATCVPFLYVDQQLSIVSGRDLFGLPKVALHFEYLFPQGRPDKPTQIGRLTLRVPRRVADRDAVEKTADQYVPFIDVYKEPPRYISARQAPANLVSALSDGINGYSLAASQAWDAILRSPIAGYDNLRDFQSALGMYRAGADGIASTFPRFQDFRPAPPNSESSADDLLGPLYNDLITLKQVRDAEDTDLVSYQALVKSTMYLDSINDGGPLFGPLSSDPLGGVIINIHRTPDQPIIESLGLITDETVEVANLELRAPRDRPPMVSTLRPIFPCWLNVDLVYGLGTNLYWRGKDTDWSSGDSPGPPSHDHRYLTFGGGALQEDPARIVSPSSTIWVLSLDTDGPGGRRKLNRLCADYLKNDHYAFQLADTANPLWMFIRNMHNTSEGRGPDVEQEIEFAALVQFFLKRNGRAHGPAVGAAFVPLYVLTDNQTAAFTGTEVFGRPVVRGEIYFLSNDWTLSARMTSILQANTLVLPELYSGGSPSHREVVRVEVHYPPKGYKARAVSEKSRFPRDLVFPSVSLKQVKDCRLPNRADFQAIVLRLIEIDGRHRKSKHGGSGNAEGGLYPIEPQLVDPKLWSVKIPRYHSLPLVEKMGLKVDRIELGDDTTIEVIQPSGVWPIQAIIEEKGAINLASRLGDSPWTYLDDPLQSLEEIEPGITRGMRELPRFKDILDSLSTTSSS
jgi:hypothetical protein